MNTVTAGAQAYEDGPISPEAWKRAVYRSAPRLFHVSVLPPEKQGGSYSYGLRVSPIKGDNVSVSTRSTSSKGSYSEYDIWRKWEDCLWFQDTIEAEYALMAREKRTRLARGKGVKKDGIYIQSDQAASFESLPPGPDPHSVARDIHKHIPKLTKKGTLFRASQATIDQRHNEFRVMINAFFQDDLPTLVKELMATRTFTDFFGFWRRDHDRAVKEQKNQSSPEKPPRRSVSSSMLSAYFSSSPVLSDIKPSSVSAVSSHRQLPRRGSDTSDSISSEIALKDPTRTRENGRPATMVASSPSRSLRSTTSSLSSTPISPSSTSSHRSSGRKPVIVTHEKSFTFGHNPQYTSDGNASDRLISTLEALPEGREIEIGKAISAGYQSTPRQTSSAMNHANRYARTFIAPSQRPSDASDDAEPLSDGSSERSTRYARSSWQTTSSVSSSHAADYLAELGVDFTLPHPHPEHAHRPRASMCTIASYRTDASADAIIPRRSVSSTLQSSATRQHRHSVPFPDEEEWVEGEPQVDELDYEDDLLDAYFSDAIPPASLDETPTADHHFHVQQYSSFPSPANIRRASITTSISSGSSDESAIAIKAMHEDSIIILRLPRSLSFTEVRQRLYDKFVRQEGVPLSETFVVAFLVPAPARPGTRPGSLWSIGAADKDSSVLHFVRSNDDWDRAIYKYGNKILLRVIGNKA